MNYDYELAILYDHNSLMFPASCFLH